MKTAKEIMKAAKRVLVMNEGEGGEMTTWHFSASAKGSEKAKENVAKTTIGAKTCRCLVNKISGKEKLSISGTAIVDYYMDEDKIKACIKEALSGISGISKVEVNKLESLY